MSYGIKISQPGFDVGTCTDQQLSFSSDFDTLKVYDRGTDVLTSTNKLITVPHNLGYVPAFVVHSEGDSSWPAYYGGSTGQFFITPITSLTSAVDNQITSYADGTNLYISSGTNFGQSGGTYHVSADVDYFTQWAPGDDNGYSAVGYNIGLSGETMNCAFRFGSVPKQTVSNASLQFYLRLRSGTESVPVITHGIDEDDTGDFTTTNNPFGRTKTSGSVVNSCDIGITQGNFWSYDVTDIFNEIVSRGGFSSGNHVGFLLTYNGTPTPSTNTISDNVDDMLSQLVTTISSSGTIANVKYTIYLNQIA